MISFVLRVHNEAVTLRASITSLFDIAVPIEIVVVLHRCTDDSKAIALGCQDAAPGRHDVRVVEYDVPVSRAGLETFITPSTSPHSLVSYYNFAFGLASHSWKFKWDGDFIATRAFVDWINQQVWGKRAPTVIHMSHRLRGSQDASNKEPYLYNCLTGFAQSNFWEVPTFPHDFHRVDAPDRAAFIHASEQAIVKSYWREPPWFAKEKQSTAEQTAEAAELRRLYAMAIQLVGPEPIGCARSGNVEEAAYLARFKAPIVAPVAAAAEPSKAVSQEDVASSEQYTHPGATPPAAVVLCKGQAKSNGALMTPRIIHHVWPGDDPFRAEFHGYRVSWQRQHPDWTLMFWRGHEPEITDPRVREVLSNMRYSVVVRSDILRLAVLVLAGGLYVDTDFESLRPMDSLLASPGFHCGWQDHNGHRAAAAHAPRPS